MNLIQNDLLLNLDQLLKAIFVVVPAIVFMVFERKSLRATEALMVFTLFVSHFFFGVFSSFLFFWVQFFLAILSAKPESVREFRLFRMEMVRDLASGLCFLIGLIFSARVVPLSWVSAAAKPSLAKPELALAAVIVGVMVQIFRVTKMRERDIFFRCLLLIYASFQVLLVFHEDFTVFVGMKVVGAISLVLLLTFLFLREFRQTEHGYSRNLYVLSGAPIFMVLLLKERAQVELFTLTWFFLASLQSLVLCRVNSIREKRWIQIALRLGAYLGIFGAARQLFILIHSTMETSTYYLSITYAHLFFLCFFGFVWLWRDFAPTSGEASEASKSVDPRTWIGYAVLFLVNPLFLIGTFALSSDIKIVIPHSLLGSEALEPGKSFGLDSLFWQLGITLSAVALSLAWKKFVKPRKAKEREPSRRRAVGTLLPVEQWALRLTTFGKFPEVPGVRLGRFDIFKEKSKAREISETQIGLALLFLLFIWFVLGMRG